MSSGYSSLEEDSEEYFFTARTSFFKKPLGKVTETKVKSQKVKFSLKIKTFVIGREALSAHTDAPSGSNSVRRATT